MRKVSKPWPWKVRLEKCMNRVTLSSKTNFSASEWSKGPGSDNIRASPIGPCLYLYLADVDLQLRVICGIINRRDFLRIHRGRYREMCKILKGSVENQRTGQVPILRYGTWQIVLWYFGFRGTRFSRFDPFESRIRSRISPFLRRCFCKSFLEEEACFILQKIA